MLGFSLILIFTASGTDSNSIERFALHSSPETGEPMFEDTPLQLNDVATNYPPSVKDGEENLTTTETPALVEELTADSVSSDLDEDSTEMPKLIL